MTGPVGKADADKAERDRKLAEALKANLKRRKAARRDDPADTGRPADGITDQER